MEITLKRLGNYSPLRYPGGKAALAGFLDSVIKAKKLHGSVYVEPYAGGAGAALTLLFLEKVERVVINDLDPAIYAFWMTACNEAEWMCEQIATVPLDVPEWRRQRTIYLDKESTQRDLGFALLYLNRTNRSGIVEGYPIGGLDQTGTWKIDARFNRVTLADRIRRIGEYSSRIDVLNWDGLAVAEKYLGENQGLVYLDPPYFVKGGSLYLNHFDSARHEALANMLNRYPGSSWLMTYDNVKEIRDLYPDRTQTAFTLHYSAHSSRQGSELLIASDSIAKVLQSA
ncbi:MAG: DNA adenine methylase [Armatimonadetes bacterium]|nr:DNA adenine methylase [Armatimonadota bacterium]